MPKGHIRDDWLFPTLEALLSQETAGVLKSAAQDSYWESAVRRGFISDDEILTALASRFHMKIANVALAAPQARLMSVVINGILTRKLPWGLVLLGVFLVVAVELLGIRSLSFAVGSYLSIGTTAASARRTTPAARARTRSAVGSCTSTTRTGRRNRPRSRRWA